MWGLLWVVCWICSAIVASRKGNSFLLWFLFGFLLGPIALILAFVVTGATCSNCKSTIHRKAKVCPFCHVENPTQPNYLRPRPQTEIPKEKKPPEVVVEISDAAKHANETKEKK
jgi:hypothetical protein